MCSSWTGCSLETVTRCVFHPTPSLDAADIDEILATMEAYLRTVLARHGADAGDDSAERPSGDSAIAVEEPAAPRDPRAGAWPWMCSPVPAVAGDSG